MAEHPARVSVRGERHCVALGYNMMADRLQWESELPDRHLSTGGVDVNRVRMMINLVLKADPGMAVISWSGSGLARVQARAREFLFELIMKKLEPREPRVFPRRYQWNLIRDDCRLRPTVSGEEDLPATVLPLHDGICLEPSSDMLRTVHERLQELHMQASSDRTSERQLVRCPVCDVAFLNPFDIHQHLRTKTHRDKEMEIQTLYEESLQRRRTGP